LIEAYQGIFAGTRIATVGFAMETAGLGCPNLLGLGVVERPVRGMVPIPGQAARGLQPWELSREPPRPRFWPCITGQFPTEPHFTERSFLLWASVLWFRPWPSSPWSSFF